MANKFKEQKKTLKAARKMLQERHKCVIIRPTGFGKTWILTELIKDYKKVLYLYPSAIIRNTVVSRYYSSMFNKKTDTYIDEDGNEYDQETVDTFLEMNKIEKCDLMTFAMLIRLTNEQIKKMKYDLVIIDEAHRSGGPLTKIALEKLFAALGKKANFIGATATPTRMDNFDFVSHFFADNMVYTYTYLDAINDGLMKKPFYCYATYDIETDLKEAALTAGENPNDAVVKEVLQSKLIEISTIYNMPNIIKDVCDAHAVDTSYMKFIVFFASKKHMNDKLDEVKKWFKDAYPNHTINVLIISSHNRESAMNVEKLNSLVRKENHIDIIACIDMLNMGYHPSKNDAATEQVGPLTGIVMYRGTKSNTIFTQQLGRAFSVGMDYATIIFDIVDNLHRKAVYELRQNLSTKGKRRRAKVDKFFTDYVLIGKKVCLPTKDGIIETQYHMNKDGIIVDANDMPSTMVYDHASKRIYNVGSGSDPRKQINVITPECLIATGHEATYRELLAKALAEPLTQRCKYALELHFKSWCYQHGVKTYPITAQQLKSLYGLQKQDFYKEFCHLIKINHIDYPLNDIKRLLQMGTDDDDIPLEVCAKARNVSISQILDMLGIDAA